MLARAPLPRPVIRTSTRSPARAVSPGEPARRFEPSVIRLGPRGPRRSPSVRGGESAARPPRTSPRFSITATTAAEGPACENRAGPARRPLGAHLTFAASVAAPQRRRVRCRRRGGRALRGHARALLDAAAAEVASVGGEVLADGDVEGATVGERLLLLEDALAEGVGADDGRAVVVLKRGGDDLRGRGGVGVDEHDEGDRGGDRVAGGGKRGRRLRAPAGRDDRALGNEDARDQPRLLDEAAAVGAQVEHDPARAGAQLALDGFAHFAVGARAERRERDHAELDAVDGARREATTGSEIVARVIFSVRVCMWPARCSAIRRVTSVPGRPLISAVAASAERPASARPFTPTIRSPARRPARAAGEESNTRATSSPRCSGPTTTPMPVKLAGASNSWNSPGVR